MTNAKSREDALNGLFGALRNATFHLSHAEEPTAKLWLLAVNNDPETYSSFEWFLRGMLAGRGISERAYHDLVQHLVETQQEGWL